MGIIEIEVPERLNPFTLAALDEAIVLALQNPRPTVLVLRGEGEVFCRGMDLAEGGGEERSLGASASLLAFAEQLVRIRQCPVPTIALVQGEALGGGLGLAAACDVVISTPDARFGLPEVLLGLIPGAIFPVLAERCTPHAIRRLALVGSTIGAEEARGMCLVDEVADDAATSVQRWGRGLSRGAPHAIQALKSLSYPGEPKALSVATRQGALRSLELLRDPRTRRSIQRHLAGDVPWSQP